MLPCLQLQERVDENVLLFSMVKILMLAGLPSVCTLLSTADTMSRVTALVSASDPLKTHIDSVLDEGRLQEDIKQQGSRHRIF